MLQSLPILNLLQDCCDPPLTPQDIEELEILLEVRFPKEYADFLLQFNGGHFSRSVEFPIPNPTEFVNRALINCFFGVPRDGIEHNGLLWYAETLKDRIPEEYLPIANCNGRDLVLLKLVGAQSEFEGVWYWDSSAFWIAEDEQSMYWLNDTFNGFLSMLFHNVCDEESPREFRPIFQAVERGAISRVEEYLAEGGDVDTRNRYGQTLLMAAAIYRWPKIVQVLLAHSANVNARDRKGRTPLHHAAEHSVDSVKLLLAA
ncbi:MAG TPA: SMI1/KNR4 family protein [Pirellulales bacterium]